MMSIPELLDLLKVQKFKPSEKIHLLKQAQTLEVDLLSSFMHPKSNSAFRISRIILENPGIPPQFVKIFKTDQTKLKLKLSKMMDRGEDIMDYYREKPFIYYETPLEHLFALYIAVKSLLNIYSVNELKANIQDYINKLDNHIKMNKEYKHFDQANKLENYADNLIKNMKTNDPLTLKRLIYKIIFNSIFDPILPEFTFTKEQDDSSNNQIVYAQSTYKYIINRRYM